ncbi:UNVERIFIED_CONTAM: Pleiotropic drug resistance protein 1 [Sesamum latifolium]|uniref:Pleiotropic drug resistance protein 1 n=1 Tax=Sesamum latifolium TaxID=2727402 RepID=A0AAW2UIY4_9LAMI
MDRGGLYKASSSFRANSSSFWRNGSLEAFSHSARQEDDEAALKWAALEKLPTYDRMTRGLLVGSRGATSEVDVRNLGIEERKLLLDRLIKAADEDNEKVGISLPTVEVRFEHLTVGAEAYIGSRSLPTFFNFTINILEGFLNYLHLLPSKKKHISILQDVCGIIRPCRLTLLLGPPSSGKTTLLLALAGKLDAALKVSGSVTYNGHEMNEFVPQRTAAYISQDDVHIGEMTVRETLEFSARCQGIGSRYEMLSELSRREKNANIKPDMDIDIFMKAVSTEGQEASIITDYILKVLSLEVCADTLVGDQLVRGISGGQKKRVTTGEMLVGPTNALFMDEISTGLDSSTTFQIVNSLRQYVHILNGTALISLLQPAPETYDLFDDIILLSDGKIVYEGPRDNVLEFFESVGFKCPERKGVADFLQEVTSKKDQQQYWIRDEPYRFVTVSEFAEAFQSFHVGRRLNDDLASPFDKSKSHPAALTTRKYGAGTEQLLKACCSRELLLMKRNSVFYIFKISQITTMSLIAMTIFLRTNMHRRNIEDGFIYVGALFFTATLIMFNGMAESSLLIYKLPVFYKQRGSHFFPPWAYALPMWILKIPISFVEVGVWVFITYYVIGFDPNVGRFFKQYLLLLLLNQMASGLFRLIGAVGRHMIIANTFGAFVLFILFTLGGVVLSRVNVKKWWIWGYWSSPLMYAQNAIIVNEFTGNSWKKVIPYTNETLGVAVMKARGFLPEAHMYWIGVAALFGFTILFNIAFIVALTYLNPLGKDRTVIPKESDDNQNDNEMGEISHVNANREADQTKKRGMILPFEPYSISFNEIVYSVDMPQEMKDRGFVEDKLVLLKGVSGAFRPGVLTALMGVSGAGKTTLMDVLAGRKTGGYIDGTITFQGTPKKQETFSRIAGYCEQNDIHSPHVTVHESLLFSAWLRLAPEVDVETRKEEVMELVELTPLRGALVGLPGVTGLSTEQRKRLTIAVELVANPSIIFMDEPTSGLDARAAAIVMRTVRNTVDTGRTVVCTIHQPSIDIFEAFDELFLLKRGGEEIYVGPLGRHSAQLIKYFEGIPGVSKIKDGYNPATWMLEVTASAQEMALGIDFAQVYKNSELYRRNKALISELSTPRPGMKEPNFPTRELRKHVLGPRLQEEQRTRYIQLYRFYMYASVLFLGIQNYVSVQPVVAVERTVFYRERAAGMYSSLPYAIAQVAIEFPYIFAQAAVYGSIVYVMIGFERTAAKFFWYIFFMYLTLSYFTFYGMMTVSVAPNHHISSIIGAAFISMWNLFSGFIVPRPFSLTISNDRENVLCHVSNALLYTISGTCTVTTREYLYGGDGTAGFARRLDVVRFSDVSTWRRRRVYKPGVYGEGVLRGYFGFRHDFLGVVAGMHVVFVVVFISTFGFAIRV